MFLLFSLLLCFILFFLPIPICLHLYYRNDKLEFYLYNKKLNLIRDTQKPRKKINEGGFFTFAKACKKLHKLSEGKYKPILSFRFVTVYGLSDCSATALLHGFLNCISPILYQCFVILFKVKKYEFHSFPQFHKSTLNIEIDGIISVSLAKIIYMLFKIH